MPINNREWCYVHWDPAERVGEGGQAEGPRTRCYHLDEIGTQDWEADNLEEQAGDRGGEGTDDSTSSEENNGGDDELDS